MKQSIADAAQTIWDYMQLDEIPGSADCLLVLGSRDDRVAYYAAELAERFSYDHILITGGRAPHNESLQKWHEETEAEHFATVMRAAGLVKPLLLEKRALNTGDNFQHAQVLLNGHGIQPKSLVIVTKPYMERRAKATFAVQWPGGPKPAATFTSPPIQLMAYCNKDQSYDDVINIMVGDLQRILVYPERGLQAKQHVPGAVLRAMDTLVAAGFTKHLLTE